MTNYCQITTQKALNGYRKQRLKLIRDYAFDQSLIDSAQAEAWKLAYREWDNRGLGGFKRWCQRDASHYLLYLENSAKES